MRLLEPLSGIKTAQGHALVHLIFFITMWFIETEIEVEHSANNRKLTKQILETQTQLLDVD
jgi:hypothetical protein